MTTRDAAQLHALWPEQLGHRAPPRMQRETLARILAYDVQVRAFGGLSKSVAKTFGQVAAEEFGDLGKKGAPAGKRRLTLRVRFKASGWVASSCPGLRGLDSCVFNGSQQTEKLKGSCDWNICNLQRFHFNLLTESIRKRNLRTQEFDK